jgi:hypothetical protein
MSAKKNQQAQENGILKKGILRMNQKLEGMKQEKASKDLEIENFKYNLAQTSQFKEAQTMLYEKDVKISQLQEQVNYLMRKMNQNPSYENSCANPNNHFGGAF